MDEKRLFGVFLIVLTIVIVVVLINLYIKSPFKFPFKKITFDVSGKRNPDINDYIDNYLIENKLEQINNHLALYNKWKKECELKIEKSFFSHRRKCQYSNELANESKMFVFCFTRERTRYQQVNYVKTSYKVTEVVKSISCSYSDLLSRYKKLEEINFEMTLSGYNSKQQRGLMTKELREKIAKRDNYTCQICYKYMPDGVGLHIDHIVPIAKGGKSVPSNLQVLCSKCNGSKSNKAGNTNVVSTVQPSNFASNDKFSFEWDDMYRDKLFSMESQIVLAFQKLEIKNVYKLLEDAEKLNIKSEENATSLHFFYQRIAETAYAMRDVCGEAMDICISLCDKDVELLSKITTLSGASIETITRKTIILEREGKYMEAIQLCDFAISRDYLDHKKPFTIRKVRLEKKLQQEK